MISLSSSNKEKENNKIGCLFGSMNPPHLGHIATALKARETTGISEVWLIPNGHAASKKNIPQAPHEDKVAMCEMLAQEAGPWLKVSGALRDQKPNLMSNFSSYFNAVTGLSAQRPDADIFLLYGADNERMAQQYHHLAKATLALFGIAQDIGNKADLFFVDKSLNAVNGQVNFLMLERSFVEDDFGNFVEASSSAIRSDICEGREPRFLTPRVREYIKERGLYL